MSKYKELVSYYEENKDKKMSDWLFFDEIFNKPGKQGFVGLLKDKNDNKYIFKFSQYINYLIEHEYTVMKGITSLSDFCPHFCKCIGTIETSVNCENNKEENPFDTDNCKHSINKKILLCEYVEKSCKFYNYIRAVEKISEDVLYSSIKQVLLGLAIAQNKKQFTHYDLHSFNIMMKKCNKDMVFLYVLDEETQFVVPTYGHYPVIIDFGFSYISDLDDGPLWPSMGHTDVGFTSDHFDWVSDPKLFLVSVSSEIKEKRKSGKSKKLRRIVKNIFSPLKIDWESGWDEDNKKAAADIVNEFLKEYNPGSKLFENLDHYCIDILQSLIILPLQEEDYSNLGKYYKIFLREWIIIENQLSSHFYGLCILKNIIDNARYVRAAYMENSTRLDAIRTFRQGINEFITSKIKYCKLEKIHYEKILCSLFMLSKSMEGMFYSIISKIIKNKNKQYQKLPLKNIEQIYAAIEVNIQDKYIYNENSEIVILDNLTENTFKYKIPIEDLKEINNIHSISKGNYIYNLYKNNN